MGPKKRGKAAASKKKTEQTTDNVTQAGTKCGGGAADDGGKEKKTKVKESGRRMTAAQRRKLEENTEEPPSAEIGGNSDPKGGKEEPARKITMAQRKNMKKKIRKLAKKAEREMISRKLQGQQVKEDTHDVPVEYVAPPTDIILEDLKQSIGQEKENADALSEFSKILERFSVMEHTGNDDTEREDTHNDHGTGQVPDQDGELSEAPKEVDQRISRRKMKEMNRIKIGELKQACTLPEVVEVWDATAADPLMLVHLKAYRNTIPVPRHWSQKRKYLQGKRGLEKPPFKLPPFIAATGIGEMRQAYNEKAEAQNLKSKGRERTQPKMGKLDIDYRILYDAFFKHQKKPALTRAGDLYYEGKEFEIGSKKHFKPGVMSDALLDALGINRGSPPPWLIAMQRYGPPPSYPSLRIPGLNAPIPHGAQFGYHPGGWGKPPVDEHGNPIYGDVFGEQGVGDDEEDNVSHNMVHWGEIEEMSESEEEESEEEESEGESGEEEESEEEQNQALEQSDLPSTVSGLDTPAEVQIRKGIETPDVHPKSLYQVLEQKKSSARDAGIMGSEHVYSLPGQGLSSTAAKRLEVLRKGMPDDLNVSIDPSDLESLDDESLRELYEAKVAEQRAGKDFSDMVAQRAASDKKRKASDKSGSKEKKFKF